jgi:hypothetical protein
MHAGSAAQAGIESQGRGTGLRSRLICQREKLLFALGIVVVERNIGEEAEAGFRSLAVRASQSQPELPSEEAISSGRQRNRGGARYQQKRDGESSTDLLIIDLGARSISLCLLNSILGKDANSGSNLLLVLR